MADIELARQLLASTERGDSDSDSNSDSQSHDGGSDSDHARDTDSDVDVDEEITVNRTTNTSSNHNTNSNHQNVGTGRRGSNSQHAQQQQQQQQAQQQHGFYDEEEGESEEEEDEDEGDEELPRVPIEKELGEYVIQVSQVSKVYHIAGREEGVRALDSITLSASSEFYPVRRGEFVMLRGPSGGGKTSLLNILGAIDRATHGEVELLGDSITDTSSDDYLARLRLSKIGFVFQTFNLLATMSAFENVELPMTVLGRFPPGRRRKRALKLLKRVGLQDRTSHLPSELSGGEQQRVTIARALSNKPEILLLDEPTGDLDTKNTIEIMDLLLDINRKYKTTCVMVTHNPDIECYADRVLYVSDGRFVKQALNYRQSRLIYSDYIKHLNSQEDQPTRF